MAHHFFASPFFFLCLCVSISPFLQPQQDMVHQEPVQRNKEWQTSMKEHHGLSRMRGIHSTWDIVKMCKYKWWLKGPGLFISEPERTMRWKSILIRDNAWLEGGNCQQTRGSKGTGKIANPNPYKGTLSSYSMNVKYNLRVFRGIKNSDKSWTYWTNCNRLFWQAS